MKKFLHETQTYKVDGMCVTLRSIFYQAACALAVNESLKRLRAIKHFPANNRHFYLISL
jgi:hypothetical protein